MAINAHVSGNQTEHTVKDFIKQPTLIEKALTVVSERQFLAENLFTKGYNAVGGSVAYQESVNKYVDEDSEPNQDFAIAEERTSPSTSSDSLRRLHSILQYVQRTC